MPKITLLFASLHALLMLGLVLPIARHRHARRIGLGDGGDTLLARRIRVHGNFIEHVPFALLVLALLELCGLAPTWLWGFGGALLLVVLLYLVVGNGIFVKTFILPRVASQLNSDVTAPTLG